MAVTLTSAICVPSGGIVSANACEEVEDGLPDGEDVYRPPIDIDEIGATFPESFATGSTYLALHIRG